MTWLSPEDIERNKRDDEMKAWRESRGLDVDNSSNANNFNKQKAPYPPLKQGWYNFKQEHNKEDLTKKVFDKKIMKLITADEAEDLATNTDRIVEFNDRLKDTIADGKRAVILPPSLCSKCFLKLLQSSGYTINREQTEKNEVIHTASF